MDQLISSGLSIKDSLDVTTMISTKKNGSGNLAKSILEQINKGTSFADSINNMPEVFPPIYRGIIQVGDKVGSVEKIFPRLRIYLENQKKMKDTFSGAMIYPLLILFTTIIGSIALGIFVLPKLEYMFTEFGGEAAELLKKNISSFKNSFLIVLILIFIFIFVLLLLKKISKGNKSFKLIVDRIVLRLPLIGKFYTYWETLNFAFAMETLTAGGVTIEMAIKQAESVISNESYKRALDDVTSDIIKGASLSKSFSSHSEFPNYMSKWLVVGERSGKTEQIFSQIRNYFQDETNKMLKRFMTLIEPTLIILIGLFLIIIVSSIIVPLFSLYGSIL